MSESHSGHLLSCVLVTSAISRKTALAFSRSDSSTMIRMPPNAPPCRGRTVAVFWSGMWASIPHDASRAQRKSASGIQLTVVSVTIVKTDVALERASATSPLGELVLESLFSNQVVIFNTDFPPSIRIQH